jgi:hypothetical protein
MREVTNLAWPTSPYSSTHRPISTPTRLLTGLWIGAHAWAAVHLPVHRTRALDAAAARIGVHAVAVDETTNVDGWRILDRLLLASRRQAVAIAGLDLRPNLHNAQECLAADSVRAPGIGALLPEWPDPTPAPPAARAARAQLLELAAAQLPAGASDLLGRYTSPTSAAVPASPSGLSPAVTAATAIALTAAVWTARYVLPKDLSLGELLDAAIGDQLTFRQTGADPVAAGEEPLR